jgi:hypothetical protein
MKSFTTPLAVLATICALAWIGLTARSQEKAAPNSVQVHMVITDQSVSNDSEVPILRQDDVQVKQGKNLLKVVHLIPAQGDNAGLQLMILIDDTCDSRIGNNLNDLREFISAQPPTTVVGVGYMSNATFQMAQNFTDDHALAAKAVRLPRGTLSAMDSPYLSLISLLKGWPEGKTRREVLMITDGIDRLHGQRPLTNTRVPPGRPSLEPRPAIQTMPSPSVNIDPASTASQHSGVIVHSIYASGVGRAGRNAWETQLGQSGIAQIADETGGEYFALGLQDAISFKPYLERLQKILNNQYFLVFLAVPPKKSELQRVDILTEVQNADIAAANNVWVPAVGAT